MKYVPWGLSIVLVALLLLVFTSNNQEINSLNQQNVALTDKYNKLVAEANEKQQLLAGETNRLLAAANLPEATVSLAFRHAMMGSGSVAILTNTSGDSIPIAVEVSRPSTGQTKNYDFVLDGDRAKEIGHQEGWPFVTGDVVNIKQPAHKAKTFIFR